MNKQEYLTLNSDFGKITANALTNKTNRTLLYGYDLDRNTWHTYLKDGEIVTVKYSFKGQPTEVGVSCNEHFVPNKRLYPARCDYEFCSLLKSKGVDLCFTTFDEVELVGEFYGEIL